MSITQIILAFILGIVFIIAILFFLPILLAIAVVIGIVVLIAIIIGIFILLLALIFAVPYYYFARKPEVQQFGNYKIEDVKGKNEEIKK